MAELVRGYMIQFKLLKNISESDTLMTFGAMFSKAFVVLLLSPLVTIFSEPPVTVIWFLFLSAIAIVRMLDFGLSPTFVRVSAYCNTEKEIVKSKNITYSITNSNVYTFTKLKFKKVACISFFISILIGSLFVIIPILNSPTPIWHAIGWFFVASLASFSIFANYMVAYCLGTQNVAKVQKLQIVANTLTGVFSTFAYLITYDIVITIVIYQLSFPVTMYLFNNKFQLPKENKIVKPVYKRLMELTDRQSKKSGLGLLLSTGIVELSGVVGANMLEAEVATKYQFALQLIRSVNGFSHAPFISKIPLLSRLYAVGDYTRLLTVAKRAMVASYWVYMLGFSFILILISIKQALPFDTGSFPSTTIWLTFGTCFLIERLGSLHIQLFSLTNVIIWHKANAVASFFTLLFAVGIYLNNFVEPLYLFPVSMSLSYLTTYVPISMYHSCKRFTLNPFYFELTTSFPVILLLISYWILF